MTVWLTSDTHFSHANIINLGEGRPFPDIQEHNEMLVKNWNDRVMPDDTVYHLGDVALGPWPEGLGYVKRLNGHKILIPGNHDRVSSLEKETRRERFRPDYMEAFDSIEAEVLEINLGGVKDGFDVKLSHYPYTGESSEDRSDRYEWLRPDPSDGMILLHGHTHSSEKVSFHKGLLQISVGVDAWDYAPVSEDQIKDIINEHQ